MGKQRHILIFGGQRFLHARLQQQPCVHTSLIWTKDNLRPQDFEANARVFGLEHEFREWLECAQAIHAQDPIQGIAAFKDKYQPWAAAIAQTLGVNYHSPAVIEGVFDKYIMREKLRAKGLDDTQSAAVRSPEEVREFAHRVGYPVILKPRTLQGSTGIEKITCDAEIEPAYLRCNQEAAQAPVVVEQMLVGEEFTGECFGEAGKHRLVATTRKFKDPQTFVEIGHQCNANLPEAVLREVEDYIPRVLQALGIQNGPTHTEFFVTPKGVRIVETHVRLAGDFIPELVQSATGIDLMDVFTRQIAGEIVLPGLEEAIEKARGSQIFGAVWFRSDPVHGVLTGVEGTDEILASPGIVQAELCQAIGTVLRPTQQSEDRLAVARSVALSPEKAVQLAREAANRIRIAVQLTPPGGVELSAPEI